MQIFAEALRAVHDYQDFPYYVHRREAESPDVRRRLLELSRSTVSSVQYYQTILNIETPLAGGAYEILMMRCRDRRKVFTHWSWMQSIVFSDGEMAPRAPFHYEAEAETSLCIRSMRAELAVVSRRKRLREEMIRLREKRDSEGAATTALINEKEQEIKQEIAKY